MRGYSIVQIKTHLKYTGDEFDQDLRRLLRRAGAQGEKCCFIVDESNVMDSGFLERMNTLLANAEIPGLFEGDEYTQLIHQCKEQAAKTGVILDGAEEAYRWFTHELIKNLHVVFTMNPPSDGISSRSATSPALFNRCVLDWFGDWNEQALHQVASEFTQELDLNERREALLDAFVRVHSSMNGLQKKPGQFHAYITPRHYLDFIHYFVKVCVNSSDFVDPKRLLQRHQRLSHHIQ